MKSKERNLPPKDDAETTLVVPRFDEEAEGTARPVVPLRRVADAPTAATRGAWPRVVSPRSAWPHGLTLALVVAAAVTLGAAVAYRKAGQTAPLPSPSSTVQQTSTEATAGEASAQPSTQRVSTEVSAAPVREPRRSEEMGESAERNDADKRDGKESERRERDAEKRAERMRKEDERTRHEQEKIFERLRKEGEKMAERRGKEKGGEQKARLVGVLTDQTKP